MSSDNNPGGIKPSKSVGRIRTRKRLNSPNASANTDTRRKSKSNDTESPKPIRLTPSEHRIREDERCAPKSGRSYKPKRFAKNGFDLTQLPYEEGYGSPPERTKFKKGHSGNRKGRPKGRKNFQTEFSEELSQKVTITENGKKLTVSKQRALIKKWFQLAVSGNTRALDAIHKLIEKYGKQSTSDETEVPKLSQEDKDILDELMGKLSNGNAENPQDEDQQEDGDKGDDIEEKNDE